MTDLVSALQMPRLPDDRTAGRLGAGRRRPPTLATLPAQRSGTLVYDLAKVDQWGRVVARAALNSLGWSAGSPIAMREKDGLILITEDPASRKTVKQGRLVLPVGLYRWFVLESGTRVLVVGDPDNRRLVIHPPTALDVMVARRHAELLDGGNS